MWGIIISASILHGSTLSNCWEKKVKKKTFFSSKSPPVSMNMCHPGNQSCLNPNSVDVLFPRKTGKNIELQSVRPTLILTHIPSPSLVCHKAEGKLQEQYSFLASCNWQLRDFQSQRYILCISSFQWIFLPWVVLLFLSSCGCLDSGFASLAFLIVWAELFVPGEGRS